jgi:hypothetical protein
MISTPSRTSTICFPVQSCTGEEGKLEVFSHPCVSILLSLWTPDASRPRYLAITCTCYAI